MVAIQDDLRPGDDVQMWSGGPPMRVHTVYPGYIRCTWRPRNHIYVGYFTPALLVRAVALAPAP